MIQHDLKLFYEVCNTINQQCQQQIHCLNLTIFDVFAKEV